MTEWKEVTATDFCKEVTDGTHDSPKPVNKGKYLLTSKHLLEYQLDFDNAYQISQEDYEKVIARSKVEQHDVLFSMIGTIGTTHRVSISNVDFAVKNMGIFKMGGDEIKSKWLYYWLKTRKAKEYIHSTLSGTTQGYITLKALRYFPVLVPNDRLMKTIVSILSSLDDKIECNRKICANLEAQAQALFKNWFVDFIPFKNGKFVDSELGMIPEGWRVGTLSEVAEINPKRTLKKGEVSTYLDMKNMPTSGPFPTNWEKREFNGGMKFQNGDALMARITPCLENGKVAYVNFLEDNEIAFGSTEYIVMTSKEGKASELLYFLCRDKDFVSYAKKNMNGSSGRQRVSGETIGNYQIIIPPSKIIDKISPIFISVMKQIRAHGLENLRLANIRDTLLPKLMSGEIPF